MQKEKRKKEKKTEDDEVGNRNGISAGCPDDLGRLPGTGLKSDLRPLISHEPDKNTGTRRQGVPSN